MLPSLRYLSFFLFHDEQLKFFSNEKFSSKKLCHHCYRENRVVHSWGFLCYLKIVKLKKKKTLSLARRFKPQKFSTRKVPRVLVYDMTLT